MPKSSSMASVGGGTNVRAISSVFPGRGFFEGTGVSKENVKAVTWNISGLKNLGAGWKFLKKYDVVLLQETWVEEKNWKKWQTRIDKCYTWKTAIRVHKK